VEVEGVNLAGASKETLQAIRAKMGFVFQDAALISNMSVYDNVALPLRYHTKLSEREVQSRVAGKMALFEVDRKSDHLIPAQVSLGMRKRVALARALVLDPALIFLDEPVMGLGTDADRLIAGVLKGYQQEARASLLMMASEWSPAFTIADRIGFLDSGRIAAEGTVQEMQAALKEMQRPASPFVSLPEK
jgi:phospholipid/cholesterol/gamma-HCH transport system ATP-binding protein